MNIGETVIVNAGEDTEFVGTYAGAAIVQRVAGGPLETLAVIRLTPSDAGYVRPSGPSTFRAYVETILVHPSNLGGLQCTS